MKLYEDDIYSLISLKMSFASLKLCPKVIIIVYISVFHNDFQCIYMSSN